MKVCDVTQFYSPKSGGVRRYLSEKRRFVRDLTSDEHYLVVPGERTEHVQEGRLHCITIRSPRVDRTSRYRILFNLRELRAVLREIEPDVIEAGDPYHVAWSLLEAGQELRVPVCGFYHSHFPDAYLRTVHKFCGDRLQEELMRFAQRYIVRLYSRFAVTFVPSQHLCELLTRWGVSNAVHAKLGVDTEAFVPGPAEPAVRKELGVPHEVSMLLYVGRLAGEKNVRTLFQAFGELRRRGSEAWLVVVGDGPESAELERLRRTTGAVVWWSYVDSNALLARLYRAATLFVHPGVVETFGLVALESQACGCPVVGIRGTNMDANIRAGLELWATDNEPRELANAIERVLAADPAALGRQAAARVREEFGWSTVLKPLWHHYEMLCK